ncbi:MAG: aminocarboxymuconate-semialdehyde decarboxylase [Gammaproteobacteria bacterium]|jgi:aminocarboxymuconate-semialdehyde decarboxylase
MRSSRDFSDAEAALSLLIETLGEERILFGTDYPFPSGDTTPGKLIANHGALNDEQKDRLLKGNAKAFSRLG